MSDKHNITLLLLGESYGYKEGFHDYEKYKYRGAVDTNPFDPAHQYYEDYWDGWYFAKEYYRTISKMKKD